MHVLLRFFIFLSCLPLAHILAENFKFRVNTLSNRPLETISSWECHNVAVQEDAIEDKTQVCVFHHVALTKDGKLRLFAGAKSSPKQASSFSENLVELGVNLQELQEGPQCLPFLKLRRTGFSSKHPCTLSHQKNINAAPKRCEVWENFTVHSRPVWCLETEVVHEDAPITRATEPSLLSVYYGSFSYNNVGHFLFDDLFTTQQALAMFGLRTRNVSFLVKNPCPGSAFGRCSDLYRMWFPIFSSHPQTHFHNDARLDLFESKRVLQEDTFIPHLLVGRPASVFRGGVATSTPLWNRFVRDVLEHFHLDDIKPPPDVLHVVIYKKVPPHRRAVVNFDAIVKSLQGVSNVRVTVIDPGPNLALADELKLIRSAHLLISPCGGISMYSGFISLDSKVLILDFAQYYNKEIYSRHMESALWEMIGTITVHYYPISTNEMIITAGAARHWSYDINVTKLTLMVETLLIRPPQIATNFQQ